MTVTAVHYNGDEVTTRWESVVDTAPCGVSQQSTLVMNRRPFWEKDQKLNLEGRSLDKRLTVTRIVLVLLLFYPNYAQNLI